MNNYLNMLPHLYPFRFIDRIIESEKGKRIVCLKAVSVNEWFFQGSFSLSQLPAVILVEIMAQASGLLIGKEGGRMAYLTMVKDVRFLKDARPGDQLVIKSSLLHAFQPLYVFEVDVYIKDETVSTAEITLSVV